MSTSRRELHLSGSLTVAVCEALKTDLSDALAQSDEVVLGLDPDADVDLTFLQLLIAAERSAHARGKQISLQTPPAGAFAEAILACGFAHARDCTSLSQIFATEGGRNR